MIRLFTAALEQSITPLDELIEVSEPWSVAGPSKLLQVRDGVSQTLICSTLEAVNGTGYFSAVCWLFGRNLFDYVNYPIGKHPMAVQHYQSRENYYCNYFTGGGRAG